jgi:hypothetical protein
MKANRALNPTGSPGPLPIADPLSRQMDDMVDEGGPEGRSKAQPSGSRASGSFGAMADAGGDAMRSMALDPVSATSQTLAAVRRHPYVTSLLLLMLGAAIVGLARS